MKRDNIIVAIVLVIILISAIVIAVATSNSNEIQAFASESDTEPTHTIVEESTTADMDDAVTLTERETTDIIVYDTTESYSEQTTTTKQAKTNTTTPQLTTAKESTTVKVLLEGWTLLNSTKTTTYASTTQETSAKMTDLDYLAAVVHQEAGSDTISDDTRKYVAEVVLNRVDSELFPNTIYDVLMQKSQYGRYYWTGIARLSGDGDDVCRAYNAAWSVLDGDRVVPENVIYQAEFPQGSGVWKYIDGIYFCYA